MSTPNHSNFLSQQNTKQSVSAATSSQTITRTLCVHIEGSLNEFARSGPTAGLWKGVGGRECSLFHPNLEDSNMNSEQNSTIINSLRNSVIKKLTLKEHQSTFPFLLGVDISCINPNEVTNIGEKFAYTVLPNSVINTPQVVYQCDSSVQDNSNWHALYSQWNGSNLEKEGVMDVPNQSFLFVHMSHPVIGLLRYNQNLIGCDIDAQPKLEKEYLKVSKQVMATCCQTIRDDILNKMKTKDMTTFNIQLKTLNNRAWDDMDRANTLGMKVDHTLSPEDQENIKIAQIKEYLTTPYQYIARLEVEYELPIK